MPGVRGRSGGRRKGAGAKKGSTKKVPYGKLAKDFGPKILEVLDKFLNGKNKADKKWAIHEILPYAIQKQPQAVALSDPRGDPLTVTFVLPEKYPLTKS